MLLARDLEAVNIYSGLLAAYHVLSAEVIVWYLWDRALSVPAPGGVYWVEQERF